MESPIDSHRIDSADCPLSPFFEPHSYHPSWWLPGQHAQTIGGWVLRQGFGLNYQRLRINTPDGDFLALDIAPGSWSAWVQQTFFRQSKVHNRSSELRKRRSPRSRPDGVVLLLHGLEGCARSGYIQWTSRYLLEHGLLPVAMNMRSCSGEPNRRPRYYHSGDTDDLDFVLDVLRERVPEEFLGVVGFSMGGNILLKHLGEQGPDLRKSIDAAAAVSVPFDLSGGVRQLERGFNRVYDRYFVDSLKEKLRRKEQRHGFGLDLDRLETIETLREIDDEFTAPLHGFRDAEDYYERCSSANVLDRIKLPTLILHARNDPFQPGSLVPERTLRDNRWIQLELRDRGGHVGFITGAGPLRRRFWCERQLARYFSRLREAPVPTRS